MSVYVDTSAFYAIVDAADSNHRSAAASWQYFLEHEEILVTSSYVVTETVALLHSRFGTETVCRFVSDNLPAVKVVWIDEAAHYTALSAMLATTGKSGPSLTDCTGFEVIRRESISNVFAYDKHFQNRGYNRVGE